MNIINDQVRYYPDIHNNLSLLEDERAVWIIQPPPLHEIQSQTSEEDRGKFFQKLIDNNFVAIHNMSINGEEIKSIRQMEELAKEHLSPFLNQKLGEELLKAICQSCFVEGGNDRLEG